MAQSDLFASSSGDFAFLPAGALLLIPTWYSDKVRESRQLPGAPGDYKVTPGSRWTVTALKDGGIVYDGIGPVEVISEGAPGALLGADGACARRPGMPQA